MTLKLKSVQKLAVFVPGKNVLDVTKNNCIRYRLLVENKDGVLNYYDISAKDFHTSGIPLHFVEKLSIPLVYDVSVHSYVPATDNYNNILLLMDNELKGIFERIQRNNDISRNIFVFYPSDIFEEATIVLDSMVWERGKWFTRKLDYGVRVRVSKPYFVENLLSVLDSDKLTEQISIVEHAISGGKDWVHVTISEDVLNKLVKIKGFNLCLNKKGVHVRATQLDDYLTVHFFLTIVDFNSEVTIYYPELLTPDAEFFISDIVNCYLWYQDGDVFSQLYPIDLN